VTVILNTEQVVLPMNENKRQVDGDEVLSALGALLSNRLACHRCATTTNQRRSSSLPPPAGQEPNQNVPPATDDCTTTALPASNVELRPVNHAGELMRHMLHDIKKLKTVITRQVATRGDARDADVESLHQRNRERQNRSRTSLSDSDDEYHQPSKGRHLRRDTRRPSFPRTSRDSRLAGDDRSVDTDRAGRRGRLHDNLQPSRPRRSCRRNEFVDDDVADRWNYDRSPPYWPPPRRKLRPPRQFMSGAEGSDRRHSMWDPILTLPPRQQSQHVSHQQLRQQHQQPVQQQFYVQRPPQQMQFYPHQIRQPQPSAFRPIQQMAPLQRHPLVFLPVHHHQAHSPRTYDKKCHYRNNPK